GDDPFQVDQQVVGGLRRLHLPAAAHLAVGVVGEGRLARVRLLAPLLVAHLADAGQEFVERRLLDRAAGLRERGVPAGLGLLGRPVGASGVGVVRPAAVVRAAGAAGQDGRQERGDAGYVRLTLHGRAPLDGGCGDGARRSSQCPRWLIGCRRGAVSPDNVYRTHCRGRRSVIPFRRPWRRFCDSRLLSGYRGNGDVMSYVEVPGAKVPIRMWTDPATVEEGALQQLRNVATLPWIKGLAVMPDVHYGKGA